MRRLMRSRGSGQALVLFALAMTVLLGMLALVVDLGIAMVQLRGLQNAADAGSLAGAQLMAGSVARDTANNVVYVSVANQAVHDRAAALVAPNRLGPSATFAYAMATEFLDCSDASLGFTAASEAALVAALGGTRLASPSTGVPNNVCKVRVHTRVDFPSLFARVLGQPTQAAGARATARIAPTSPPTRITSFWPISRWAYNDPACAYQVGRLCTFWDSNAPPGGSFKEVIDVSRYSALIPLRNQFWVDYDHRWPGTNDKLVDLPQWIRHGWQGTAAVDEANPLCQTASLECPNSKFELFGGDMGHNIAEQMRAYINDPANREGTDPVRGSYATISVFFWRYGEQGINPSTGVGTIWGGAADPTRENPNNLQRIILQKTRRFRFYTSTVSSSQVQGYFVSFYTDGQPQAGPPSGVANTVVLTE